MDGHGKGWHEKAKGMFGNCIFLNFLFSRLENLLGNGKHIENKNDFHMSIYKGN